MNPRKVHYSPDSEISVLGAMLLEDAAAARALEVLAAADFYRPGNVKCFAAMQRIRERGDAIDPTSLGTELHAAGELGAVGGVAFIGTLSDAVPSAVNLATYIRRVREDAALRRLDAAGEAVRNAVAAADGKPAVEVHAEAQRIIADVVTPSRGPAMERISDCGHPDGSLLWREMEELERIGTPGEIKGIQTGLTDLDRMLGGLMPGDLIILAARPSMGKSGMAIGNFVANAALSEHKRVAVFSQETKKARIVRRLIAAEARIDLVQAKARGCLADDDYPHLARAAGLLNAANIFVDDTPGITLAQMRAKLRQMSREEGPPELIVEDYLGKMTVPGAKDRMREVSAISNGLKEIAMEFNCPVVALSQLSRKVEDRTDKRPMMSDLRDSGEIEQDADVVLLLYRPEYYFGPRRKNRDHTVDNLEGVAEVIVGKQRDGTTGNVQVFFEKEYAKFANWRMPRWDAS